MGTITMARSTSFYSILASSSRSAEIPESEDVYGWLVGDWELEVLHYKAANVSAQGIKGEAHFGWVLEGRAIQDVWIMPRVSERTPATSKMNNMYGTTLRIWDPALGAWHIRWFNPVTNHFESQIGRRSGSDIVQVGARADGTATRWRFTEITPESFHWIGESLAWERTNVEDRGRVPGKTNSFVNHHGKETQLWIMTKLYVSMWQPSSKAAMRMPHSRQR